ncbi:hypothetical protein [Streptomyces sp. NPDC020983]|uniref:hypothetical protein n=1 Tax=Streptomyces sp. NPDC020983 TaxID=3365106 RepID=UPI0037AC76BD
MKLWTKRIALGLSATALCMGAAAGTASAAAPSGSPAASAGGIVKPMDWNGNCYAISYTSTSFTGWCDGTGPYNYGTYVVCSNGGTYDSTYVHWYGDRRGVTAYCPSGTTRVSQGYDLY